MFDWSQPWLIFFMRIVELVKNKWKCHIGIWWIQVHHHMKAFKNSPTPLVLFVNWSRGRKRLFATLMIILSLIRSKFSDVIAGYVVWQMSYKMRSIKWILWYYYKSHFADKSDFEWYWWRVTMKATYVLVWSGQIWNGYSISKVCEMR